MTLPSYGVVLLTMGTRPEDLRRALGSVLDQRGVTVDVVVVGNGWEPTGLPPGVRGLCLPENVGIPAGRNAGVDRVEGELLFFLDDDAWLSTDDVLARLARHFERRPRLAGLPVGRRRVGMVQPRVLDPTGRPSPRRWTPRLHVGDPGRSSFAVALWEGAVAVRRDVFLRARGWPARFFYAHEGIELTWRVWDTGAAVWYAGDVVVHHLAIPPTRHPYFMRLNARNRVWLARRNLPAALVPVYLGAWVALTLARERSWRDLRAWFAGFREGLTTPYGARRTLRWSTVVRMALAGRPPVV